jgi:hypothetical protein
VHLLPDPEIDPLLIRRIGEELAHVPAFHESITTVTGKPHGYVLCIPGTGATGGCATRFGAGSVEPERIR